LTAERPTPAAQRRALPAVDRVLAELGASAADAAPAVREVLDEWRAALAEGRPLPDGPAHDDGPAWESAALLRRAAEAVARRLAARPPGAYARAVNASGIFLHTGMGRAPLAAEAARALAEIAEGFTLLELDPADGLRRHREQPVAEELCALIGAQSASVVNNNAAALLLCVVALAAGREVVVSRGELIEIGGGFRLPELIAQSGARLVEVGTTNRTYVEDYLAATTPATALWLRMHTSNYRVVGFTHAPTRAELAAAAHDRGLPLVEDIGSGLLWPPTPAGAFPGAPVEGLVHEPDARSALAQGADLVLFSGDKLLGGPQAGVLAGRADLVAACRRAPLFRALRPDRLALAALSATLAVHRRAPESLPIARALAADARELRARADSLAAQLGTSRAAQRGLRFRVVPSEAQVGSGSLPARTRPSFAVEIHGPADSGAELARRLRTGHPPVLPAERHGRVVLDVFALLAGDAQRLHAALDAACDELPRL